MSIKRELNLNNYDDQQGCYYPIDDYETPMDGNGQSYKISEVILEKSYKYHIILVPLIGQCNDGNLPRKTDWDWCGRTCACMVYNYWILAKEAIPKEKYIKHWDAGKNWYMDLRHFDGTSAFYIYQNTATYYDGGVCPRRICYDTENEKGIEFNYNKQPLLNMKNRELLLKNKKLDINTLLNYFGKIIKCLENNNPVILYTGISYSRYAGHIILVTGYVIIEGVLWLVIADPATIYNKIKKNLFNVYYDWEKENLKKLNNYNTIVINWGKWYKARASLYLLKASHLFGPHPLYPNFLVVDYGKNPSLCGYQYSRTKYFNVPKELLISNILESFVYPLQTSVTAFDSAIKYFYKAEAVDGGIYPTGYNQTLHGGIHLKTEESKKDTEIRCVAPGYIVAARLNAGQAGVDNPYLYKFLKNYISFILVKHDLQELNNKGEPKEKSDFSIYSLYMHIKPPDWPTDNPSFHPKPDDKYLAINWIKKIVQARFKCIVNLDAADKNNFGKIFWATNEVNDKWTSAMVYDLKKDLKRSKTVGEDTINIAYAKDAPKDMAQAYKGLLNGAIITFDKPFLKVKKGEILGFINTINTRKNEEAGFLHWELLSPCGEGRNNALNKILELFERNDAFQTFEEEAVKDDNFLEKQELEKLFKILPEDNPSLRDKVEDTQINKINEKFKELKESLITAIPETPEGLEKLQSKLIKKYREFLKTYFKDPNTSGFIESEDDAFFTYPIIIKIPEEMNLTRENYDVKVEFLANDKPEAVKTENITLTDLKSDKGKVFHVPYNADIVKISCPECHIEHKIPADRNQINENEKDLLSKIISFRLRNIHLKHINEWTETGLKTLLKKLYDKGYLDPYYDENGEKKKDASKEKQWIDI